jgi:hypothetical protein
VGRRSRRQERLRAPASEYGDAAGNLLSLRGSLTPGARREYATALRGGTRAADTIEDVRERALELLFERLAASWTIAGAPPIERQRELLGRLRMASPAEREWVRGVLREHCAEHFPDVRVP